MPVLSPASAAVLTLTPIIEAALSISGNSIGGLIITAAPTLNDYGGFYPSASTYPSGSLYPGRPYLRPSVANPVSLTLTPA